MMITTTLNQTKQWLKNSDNAIASYLLEIIKSIRQIELPAPQFIFTPLYYTYTATGDLFSSLMRIFWMTPLFKGRANKVGRRLNLFGGLPFISGSLEINVGDDCRISGRTTFSGRTSTGQIPVLNIGNNVDIGYMTSIAVAQHVVIGNNVRIAGRSLLAGYPGHPIDRKARAAGFPDTDDQIGNIIIEDDVWLATGVSVMSRVRIGRGTIVAARSVVTHDLPPMVLAGGIPARVIRQLEPADQNEKLY